MVPLALPDALGDVVAKDDSPGQDEGGAQGVGLVAGWAGDDGGAVSSTKAVAGGGVLAPGSFSVVGHISLSPGLGLHGKIGEEQKSSDRGNEGKDTVTPDRSHAE
jgi:hypothetical protein